MKNQSKKSVELSGAVSAENNAIQNILETKLQAIDQVQKLAKQRKTCQLHLEKINLLIADSTASEWNETETENVDSIDINTTRSRNSYEIKNTVLVAEILEFIKTKLNDKFNQLNQQITQVTF